MTTLRYIGTHQPVGMLVDVEEKEVERLLSTGEYEPLEFKKKIIIPKEESDDSSKRFTPKI